MRDTKFGSVDQLDVFTNTISRNIKHIYVPMIIGVIGAFVSTYFIASYFPSDNLNTYYIDGLYQSIKAQMSGIDILYLDNEEISTSRAVEYFTAMALDNLTTSLIVLAISFIITSVVAFDIKRSLAEIHSEKFLEDQHIKGTKIISEKALSDTQTKNEVLGAIIGNTAKLDEDTECQHTFISGSAGTGKTVILSQIYTWQKQHRLNGRWIVHDTKGDYIERFYNSDTDYIFNFSDSRGFNFNIFSVIQVIPDIKAITASIIPRVAEEKDPVWTDTARDLLEACILYCIKHNKKTNLDVRELIRLNPDELAKKLKDVKGAEVAYGHLTSSESQAGNFMSNFRTKASFFTSLPDTLNEEELDLEKWLNNVDGGQSTIFLLNDTKNKDLNAIRISVFVDSLIKTLLSMSESKTRRVYFFLDELGSLNKISSIVDGLALTRSFGGAFFLGIQEINRLYAIYGKDLTSTIVNNTATKIILRAQEVETQKFCSNQIGEAKIKSTTITNSTGSEINANREGSSFSTKESIENAILASEIGDMKNNTYYYKNASSPWAYIEKVFTDADTYEKTQKAFIPRKDLNISNLFKEEVNLETEEDSSGSAPSGGGQSLEKIEIPDTLKNEPLTKDTSKVKNEAEKDTLSSMRETEEVSYGL